MDLNLYGSQISRDRIKSQPYESNISDRSKSDTKMRKTNPNRHNFLDLGVQGSPVWSVGRDRQSSGRSKESDSARSRNTPTNRSKQTGISKADGDRRGEVDTFLNLGKSSQDLSKMAMNDTDRYLYEQDVKDWEEISISTPRDRTAKSSQKNSAVIPINKNAFESQNFTLPSERDLESVWSGSLRTLTPEKYSPIQDGDTNRNIVRESYKQTNIENQQDQAATIIQRWFRRHIKRYKLAKAAMRRMLTEKRNEIKNKPSSIDVIEGVRKSVLPNKKSPPTRSNITNGKYEEHKISQQKAADKRVAELEIENLKLDNKIHSRPASARLNSSRSKLSTTRSVSKDVTNPKTPVQSHRQSTDRKTVDSNRSSVQTNQNNKATLLRTEQESDIDTDRSTVKSELFSKHDVRSAVTRSEITTIDDIFSTIKELESVDCLTERSSASNVRGKDGWNAITADIDKLLQPDDFKTISNLHINPLTATSLDMHNKITKRDRQSDIYQATVKPTESIISDSKMNDILRFLNTSEIVDNVSDLETKPIQETPIRRWNVYNHTELEENSKNAVHEVSSKLMTMKLELEEKHRSVEMLQKALQQQRELTIRQVKETQKDMEKRINCQKDEYESALQRNHTFIDELISKNEILQDKCNKLVIEMKDKTVKSEDKIKNLIENHNVELKKVESKHVAAEKLRREKWETEKTKMIKDMTIKGMETEIAQLISNHKQELRKLKQYYENELLQGDQKSYEKYNQQLEDLRKQLYKEKEEAVQKEHDIVKERFDQEMQRQIQILEGQRRQLYQEISDERDRINVMATKQKSEVDKLRSQLEYKEDKVGENLKIEFKIAKEEIQRKYETEIRDLKMQSELEKQIWMETQNKKNMAALLSREQELKNEMRKNRDEEIEKVIHQLEEDNAQSKEELEAMFNNKLKRAKDKYDSEINELELSEKQAKEKYNIIRAEHMELQGDHEGLKVMLRQKEKEIDDIKQMYETLHREREHVSDIIRQEFADRLVATEEENRKLKREISEIKAKLNHLQISHSEELERIKLGHQSDMTEVHNKVKEAIKRKEENMTELRNQFQNETKQWQEKLAASEKRSEHLESLLEQQRKQLLKLK